MPASLQNLSLVGWAVKHPTWDDGDVRVAIVIVLIDATKENRRILKVFRAFKTEIATAAEMAVGWLSPCAIPSCLVCQMMQGPLTKHG